MKWTEFTQRASPDVMALIYAYDDTYRGVFRRVIAEFHANQWQQWKHEILQAHRHPLVQRSLTYLFDHAAGLNLDPDRNAAEPSSSPLLNLPIAAASYDDRVRYVLWHHHPWRDAMFLFQHDTTHRPPSPPPISLFPFLENPQLEPNPEGLPVVETVVSTPAAVSTAGHGNEDAPPIHHRMTFSLMIGRAYQFHGEVFRKTVYRPMWHSPHTTESVTAQQLGSPRRGQLPCCALSPTAHNDGRASPGFASRIPGWSASPTRLVRELPPTEGSGATTTTSSYWDYVETPLYSGMYRILHL